MFLAFITLITYTYFTTQLQLCNGKCLLMQQEPGLLFQGLSIRELYDNIVWKLWDHNSLKWKGNPLVTYLLIMDFLQFYYGLHWWVLLGHMIQLAF
jgi:hypothetical protein